MGRSRMRIKTVYYCSRASQSQQQLKMPLVYLLLSIVILEAISSGSSLVENVSPQNGSTIAGFEGSLNTTTLMCDIFVSAETLQITTQWSIENFRGSTGLQVLPPDEDLFLLTGDELPSDPNFIAHNHLILLNLTSELDGVTIYCGTGRLPQLANFKLRIYREPRLLDDLQVMVLEGMSITIDLSEEDMPPAFPFPEFQWIRSGVHTMNVSNVVAYKYPSVTFFNISRADTGFYSLLAQNFAINDTGIPVGNDSGGVTIDVLYGPELTSNSSTFVTLQQKNVTLLCGNNLLSNPPPVIQWFSNTNNEINRTDDRFSVDNGPEIVALTIFNSSQSDDGVWYCVLTLNAPNGSTIQQLQRNLTLTILIPPSEPENITVESFGSTWISLLWLRPTFLGMPADFTGMYQVMAVPANATNSNSLAMTPPQPVILDVSKGVLYANITELFPGQEYHLSVSAVIEDSNVQARSNSSVVMSTITHTTVPEVLCKMVPQSENGRIEINWEYRHTGGLSLTQITVEYRQNQVGAFQKHPQFRLDLKRFATTNLTAGYTYNFRVVVDNENGSASADCPSVAHMIGIPQVPVILNATSTLAGVVTLNVSTREAGIPDGDIVEFVIKATVISDGTSKLFIQEVSDYLDSTIATVTVSGLLSDTEYQFSVRVQNAFGTSEFSERTKLRIQPLPPRTTSSTVAAIAGGVATSVAIITLIIVIVLVIVISVLCRKSYVRNLEKNKFFSNDSSVIQDNNLYKTNNQWQDGGVHYTAVDNPVITTSRPQSEVYNDGLATPTPSHYIKRSDNPLYSSTQELRMIVTYDPVSPRARSLTPSAVSSVFPTSSIADHGKIIEDNSSHTSPTPMGNNSPRVNNRPLYSFELNNHESQISPVNHQRSSQIANSIYTEL